MIKGCSQSPRIWMRRRRFGLTAPASSTPPPAAWSRHSAGFAPSSCSSCRPTPTSGLAAGWSARELTEPLARGPGDSMALSAADVEVWRSVALSPETEFARRSRAFSRVWPLFGNVIRVRYVEMHLREIISRVTYVPALALALRVYYTDISCRARPLEGAGVKTCQSV